MNKASHHYQSYYSYFLTEYTAAARMATAAAAAGVMNPSLLAASFHAANFTVPNNTESQNEMGNIMERDSSARSSVLLLPPYMSSFTQVSGLILEYQLK